MPQALVALCHLANIIDSALCRGEDKIKKCSEEWPCAFAVGSCLQYAVVATVHLFFLLSMIISNFWKKGKTYQFFFPPKMVASWRNGRNFGSSYKATLGSCILLCLSHLVVAIWGVIYHRKKGMSRFAMVELVEVVQTIAWYSMTAATACTEIEKRERFSSILRTWWIASFFISAWTFVPSLLLLTRYVSIQVTAWAELLAFPICVFLCIVAINGRTGFSKSTLDVLLEPLLNEPSQKTATSEKVTEYATAGLLSLATFSWLDPLLSFGYRKPLVLDDIPQLAPADAAKETFGILSMNWEKDEAKSLYKCLVQTFWKATAINGCFAALSTCALYVGPYLINDFVEYLAGRQQYANEGYVLAVVFFGAKIVESFAQRHWFFGSQQLTLRLSAGLTSLIYRKGLSLSHQSRQSHTSGEIINYMSVDVQRISDFYEFLHELWLMPIQICLALIILYKNLGIASLAAFGATAFALIANLPLSTAMDKLQDKIMMAKDERMKATSEVLRGMKVLKLQAWEMKYLKKLENLRKVEQGWIFRYLYTRSAVVSLYWWAPTIIGIASFSTSVLIGIPLTAGRVLSALATFRILQAPIFNLPDVVTMLSQTRVSLDRISKFLKEQEMQVDAVDRSQYNMGDMAIEINGASFSWNGLHGPIITVSELQIKQGLRVAVCGMVGSGKSSLLSCILGEIPRLSGFAKVNGSRAYVAQSAWIQSGKIQDNILFGKPLDSAKYEYVLQVCALTKDLELFSHGDQTEIGERGVNLSGGQKQRIQLARAIYQDADIYLLDDPFSAVDAHTGTHLFKECIVGALQNKTVVYVTHQIEFLPAADIILVLQNGSIVQAGKFDDLLQAGSKFDALIGAYSKSLESVECMESSCSSMEKAERMNEDTRDTVNVQSSILQQDDDADIQDQKALTQIVQEEDRETGNVSMAVYWSLASAAYGGALVPVILLCQTVFQSLQIASNYWMAWATPFVYDSHPTITSYHLLAVYIGLGAASALCILIRALLVSNVALVTAQKFFINMLRCIFQAPMSFFDSTPTGRILNRVSTDQSALDQEVTQRFAGLAFNIIQLIGVVVVMSQVAWQVFALFIPVLGLCFWLQRYYIATARELARLVGIRRAPIIHHFGESISGAATIRGFDQESRFMDINLHLIDCYSRPLFNNFAVMEWLCLRLDLLTNCIFTFSLLLVVSLPTGAIDASIAGLAVTYALNLSVLQTLVVWNLCNLENKIISVERIQQYTCIPSEASLIVENSRPPADWPSHGTISFENLQVRYAPHMPLVLHGITCTFSGGSKIGVVGRTGSGKSTLIQVLFRIVEPVAGKVSIDEIDISKIGLHDLRSKLSIIPQDPTMFEGSLRSNLDPLEEHTDSEVWEAIEKSQLGDVIRSKDQKLDSLVTENGDNWSVGQRQLVCLGRALLKRTRILVLDEATASVDTATDRVIQDTVRTEFENCTVVTIAHRIPTVIDCDWVLLLKDGRVGECNSPARLLEDRSSLFAKLVSEYTTRSTRVNGAQ